MKLHLVDGTYELFRHYFGAPKRSSPLGREVGAVVGLIRSLTALLRRPDVTHVGCAFDQVIRSFRNDLFDGYKTGDGIDPDLLQQFPLAEQATGAMGLTVWPGVEFEADDLIASAVAKWRDHLQLDGIVICTPDKDLAQCVVGERVVCWDRRRDIVLDGEGVVEKFGVAPESIPDLLALVGDSADGIPGVPRWGLKSASIVLRRYRRLEDIPEKVDEWDVSVRGARALSESLQAHSSQAALYKRLATLREDAPIPQALADLRWAGAHRTEFDEICDQLGTPGLATFLPSPG